MEPNYLRRFLSKIGPKNKDGCRNWLGTKNKDGYGLFYLNNKRIRAHRMMFFVYQGKWPSKFCIHSCDNPSCVSMSHLRDGSNKDNMQDQIIRKRNPRKLKTECPSGHFYSGDNLIITSEGWRACRACKVIASQQEYSRRT